MSNLADSILVPGVYVTIDNSLANTAQGESFKTVLIGQKTSAGDADAETLTQVFSASDAHEKFGNGSILAVMFEQWFVTNGISEVYGIALDDAAGAVEETAELALATSTFKAGTLAMYINGKRFAVPVATGDAATDIVTEAVSVINDDVFLPVTASDSGAGVLLLTAKNGGTLGTNFTLKINQKKGDELPSGLTATVTDFADGTPAGATDPDIADAIAALPDNVYNLIINPYTDSTSLAALKTELDRRWGNTVQLDGHAIHAFGGTASEVGTKGDALNSEHFTFIDSGKDTMQPPMYWAANLAGRIAFSASADPARPFRTLGLAGIIGDDPSDQRNLNEKNTILTAGIGTHNVLNDGSVVVGRLVTTYKENALGAPDNSYQNTNTMFNLSKIRQAYIIRMLSRFPRHKLADDGTAFGAGQAIATPSVIKAEILALYRELSLDGLVEDIETFADTLSVERDATNRSKANVVMKPILIGQLYQFDITLQFIV